VTRGVGDIDNPFIVQLPNGKIVCAFRNHSRDSGGRYTWFRITACGSDNGGADWRYLSTVEEVSSFVWSELGSCSFLTCKEWEPGDWFMGAFPPNC